MTQAGIFDPIYLLIQGDVVVDRCLIINYLRTERIAEYAGFKIAVGYVDATGKRHVAGVLADVAPLVGCKTWQISGKDWGGRVINAESLRPAAFIKYELRDLPGTGLDLRNLPPTLTIEPGEKPSIFIRPGERDTSALATRL